MPFELVEVTDGLLSSPDKVIMKARCPELFPENVQEYLKNRSKMDSMIVEDKLKKVTIISEGRYSVFNTDYFDYIRRLESIEWFLSNVALPGEDDRYYPLIAKYKGGWVVLAPLEVYA